MRVVTCWRFEQTTCIVITRRRRHKWKTNKEWMCGLRVHSSSNSSIAPPAPLQRAALKFTIIRKPRETDMHNTSIREENRSCLQGHHHILFITKKWWKGGASYLSKRASFRQPHNITCISGVWASLGGTRSSSQKSTEHMALLNTVILNKCQIKHCYFEHLPVEQE